MGNICGFPMWCSILRWTVDVWLDWGLLPEEGCLGPVEGAGSSQLGHLPESCPGRPLLDGCQAPSSTRSARWVGPFRGRRGLPDTSPHGDSGAGLWGVLGLGQVNHHGRSWRGVGAVLQWAVVFVSVYVCVFGAGLQSALPSLHLCLPLLLFPHCHQAGWISSQPSSLQTKAFSCWCCLELCCLHAHWPALSNIST